MSWTRRRLLATAAVAGAGVLVGCDGSSPEVGPTDPTTTEGPSDDPTSDATTGDATTEPSPTAPAEPTRLRVVGTVAEGLTVPWGIAFLPGGGALVSERDTGRIVRVGAAGSVRTVTEVAEAAAAPGTGEGGLLGLALSPDGRGLYAYHSTDDDNRIVRMSWNGRALGRPRVVLDGIPRATIHNGGALAIGPDGLLYASTGDAGDGSNAPDVDSLGGKVLRMRLDGSPAPGNPYDNQVFSSGHRNVEGLAFDGAGRLWASEFGNDAYDELNLIEAGQDYGWPRTEGPTDAGGITGPQAWWPTDAASPAGLAVAHSTAYLGALRGQCVWAVPLAGRRAREPRRRLGGEDLGRIRAVALAPDGLLWVATSNTDGRGDPRDGDDRIVRVRIG
ncbi:glucose/arabinose dehydrogenase [Mumia flava]|uniref:Glucose/arabinose dehydrogenase n=1 Tax=Mumia flava TaxID=1348852 RepID=A0A0B2BAY1_9ACTN|nr:PQQ-dependent sugar dehydrogenase [Mumia flava]PJJ53925.1 glucose/arabinose dehydrogenase [Mumia flava]